MNWSSVGPTKHIGNQLSSAHCTLDSGGRNQETGNFVLVCREPKPLINIQKEAAQTKQQVVLFNSMDQMIEFLSCGEKAILSTNFHFSKAES